MNEKQHIHWESNRVKGTGMNNLPLPSLTLPLSLSHTHTQYNWIEKGLGTTASHTGSKWIKIFRKILAPNQLSGNNASHTMWHTALNPSIATVAGYESDYHVRAMK